MRVKRGTTRARQRSRFLKRTKGYRWGRKNRIRLAKTAVLKAGVNAYRDRKLKKRNARRLWQIQINAASRAHGLSYSALIAALKKANIELDRKILSDLARSEPKTFRAVLDTARKVK